MFGGINNTFISVASPRVGGTNSIFSRVATPLFVGIAELLFSYTIFQCSCPRILIELALFFAELFSPGLAGD